MLLRIVLLWMETVGYRLAGAFAMTWSTEAASAQSALPWSPGRLIDLDVAQRRAEHRSPPGRPAEQQARARLAGHAVDRHPGRSASVWP